jgi:hypothetical protein
MKTIFDHIDEEIFGNEAGEEEDPEVLDSYFVKMNNVDKLWDFKNRLAIIRARKGLGKSTLLAKLNYDKIKDEPEAILLFIKRSDLQSFFEPKKEYDPNHLINQWQVSICKHLNCKIGEKIGFAFSDTAISMVETSELAGFRGRNIIGSLIDRLKIKLPLSIEKKEPQHPDHKALLKRFEAIHEYRAWIFIDDIDATFFNNPESCLQISTFFSCCRKMITDFKGLSIRVSVRTDVWSVINRIDEAMDKCDQYITDLVWEQSDFDKMLARRIYSYLNRRHLSGMYGFAISEKDPLRNPRIVIREIFAPKFIWAGETYSPSEFIFLFSDGRPRWAINLCKRAFRNQAKDKKRQICQEHFYEALDNHGKARLDDLYKEHKQQFPKIEQLIQVFSGGEAYYKTESLLFVLDEKFVKKNREIEIDGVVEKADCLRVADLLYRIGFIYANKYGNYNLKNVIQYEDRPDLLKDIGNLDVSYYWMIKSIYQKRLNVTARWANVPPNEWREKFFHFPYRESFRILEEDEKVIPIGEISLVIKVLEIREKEARISITEKRPTMKTVPIKIVRKGFGKRVTISREIRTDEERSLGIHYMEKEDVKTVKVLGVVYFFKVTEIFSNPNLIEMTVYNELHGSAGT